MDLQTFKESTRPAAGKASAMHREWTRLKYWFVPATHDKRKERFTQYRNFAIFGGAIVAVTCFEERIRQLFEIDTAELTRGM